MRRAFAALVLAAALAPASASAVGDPVTARASVDTQSITVGDPILLTVRVEADRGYTVVDPGVARTLGALEVLETLPAQQTGGPAGLTRLAFRYRLTAFSLGELAVPAIDVVYAGPGGARGVARTAEIPLEVASVLRPGEDYAEIKPLRPQLALGGGLPYAIARGASAAGAVVVASLGLVMLGRVLVRRRRAPDRADVRAPGAPADRSLEALGVLEKAGLPEEGRFEEHYERLGGALRDYLAARHGLAARGRTAAELRRDMERAGLERSQAAFVFEVLREGELVRFRHTPPSPRRANEVARAALDFLRRAALADEYARVGRTPVAGAPAGRR